MSDEAQPFDAAELHRQQEAHLSEIERQIKAEQPLTSHCQPVSCLYELYKNNPSLFQRGIQSLEQTYSGIRLVRGDGSCFYRAFLYRLAEQLLPDDSGDASASALRRQQRLDFLKDPLDHNWNQIIGLDEYEETALEIFYETTRDFFQNLTTAETLHDDLGQENAVSDYGTWFLRLVTAAYLKRNAERFAPFIVASMESMASFGGTDVAVALDKDYVDQVIQHFCASQVEPMTAECEDVQVMALAEAMHCQVSIEYLDGHGGTDSGNSLSRHVFGPNECLYKINLLYRPGHYDILYQQMNA